MKSISFAYKGFEIFYNTFRMNLKMITISFAALFFFQLAIFIFMVFQGVEQWEFYVLIKWFYAWLFHKAIPDLGIKYTSGGQTSVVEASYLVSFLWPYVLEIFRTSFRALISSAMVYGLFPFIMIFFGNRTRELTEDKHIKGSSEIPINELNRLLRFKKKYMPFGKTKLPYQLESQHVFFIGAPGTGKTNFLNRVIKKVVDRNCPSIIYDFKGDFVSRYYREGIDHIFNPLDSRCCGWNLFNDIKAPFDIDAISASLIPPAYHAEPFWNDGARDVLAGMLHFIYKYNEKCTNKNIWHMVGSTEIKEITKSLKKTKGGERGYRYIEDASSKQALSIMAVLMQYAKAFEFMGEIDGDFSISQWAENPTGNIFITNYSEIRDTLRPILSLFVDLLSRKILALDENINRRIFIFLDEFGTLQRLSSIVNLLTLGRSKGASTWIGIQDIGQLEKIYTDKIRQAIVNACGNSLIFRVSDPTTAKFLSDKIGSNIRLCAEEVYSMGVNTNRDGVSINRREKIEPLIIPSQLMNMRNLTGYVKFVGYPLAFSKFRYKDFPPVNEIFKLREGLLLEKIQFEYSQIEANADSIKSKNPNKKKVPKEKLNEQDLITEHAEKLKREKEDKERETVVDIANDDMAIDENEIEMGNEGIGLG